MAKRLAILAACLVAAIALTALVASIMLVRVQGNDAMEEFAWLPTECAPRGYPMEIVRGDLVFADGSSVYIPDKKVFHNGWGEIGSTHIVGAETRPVPVTLDLTWFSYTEDKFYAGVFALPQEAILAQFKRGIEGPATGGKTTYDRIIVGMAPGGHVSVWLEGQGVALEVAGFTASAADVSWTALLDNDEVSRPEYVRMVLKEALGVAGLASLVPAPKGLWERYRRRYPWRIEVVGAAPTTAWIKSFNGEREYVQSGKGRQRRELRAVPREIKLNWRQAAGRKRTATLELDEAQVFSAFETLAAADETSLALRVVVKDSEPMVDVSLAKLDDEAASRGEPEASIRLDRSTLQVHALD